MVDSNFVFDPADFEIYRKIDSNLKLIKSNINDISFTNNKNGE